jgi:serine phosphatase RsbU (regulator of sigma subunit)
MFDRWGRRTHEFLSTNLPLGIVDNQTLSCTPLPFTWGKEDQLVICSDGLLEATNTDGVQFGIEGLMAATANSSPENRFKKIEAELERHLVNSIAADDISLMIIDCP